MRIRHKYVLFVAIVLAIYQYSKFNIPLDRNFDRAMYHDYVSDAFLKGWLLNDWMAAGINSWTNPISQLPRLFFEVFFGSKYGDDIFGITLLTALFVIIWKIGQLVFQSSKNSFLYCTFAAIFGVLSPFFLGEVGTSFQNASSTIPILLGIYYWLRYNSNSSSLNIFFSGLFFGISVTLKLTNIVYLVAALFAVELFLFKSSRSKSKKLYQSFLYLLAIFIGLIPTFIWSCYTYLKTDSPIYPFYNAFFKAPSFPFRNFRDDRWSFDGLHSTKSLFSGFFLNSGISELRAFSPGVSLLSFLLVLWLLIYIIKLISSKGHKIVSLENNETQVLIWYVISVIIWATLFFYARYFEPLEVLSGLVSAIIIRNITKCSNYARNFVQVILVSLMLLGFITLRVPNWTEASAVPNLGQQNDRWDSPLVDYLSDRPGLYLVSGEPISFIRTSVNEMTNMIRGDYGKPPARFMQIVQRDLELGNLITLIIAGNDADDEVIRKNLYLSFGLNAFPALSCTDLVGPISVNYRVCDVTLGPNLR